MKLVYLLTDLILAAASRHIRTNITTNRDDGSPV